MDNKLTFGERMREERSRLGLTQQEAANLLGVGREMWSRYERGVALPGGEALMALADAGGDVQYVLTGQRSNVSLSPDERELLSGYRKLDIRGKANMLGMLDVVSTAPAEKPTSVSRHNIGNVQFHGKVGKITHGDQHVTGDQVINVGGDGKKAKKPKKNLGE
ncbi:helix-turn-helix domain-containing protein [Collimonas sp. NPDC087041]|uniref:helix-turn-helix domain-containing protein n=1 Tax=Collimonas sp. NPDC087041 TaxID=3363960 RepID=UPI00382C531A